MSGLVLGFVGGAASRGNKDNAQEAQGEAGKGDDEPDSWVTVLETFAPAQAQIGAARLADAGIPTRLRQEAASSALPVIGGLLGLIEVRVPEATQEAALAILEDTLGGEEDYQTDLPPDIEDYDLASYG